jgi:replicative DNA helicase
MAETDRLISEGAALDEFLDELQREHEVREIAGWDTGFANLNSALDGVFPGLYLLVGPSGYGKTSFAKQLLDRVVMRNDAVGVFISFAESKKELRIKTLARLSGIENKEIRRGSAYLLHWYGVPRLAGAEVDQLSPSWERVRLAAENARSWLDSVFLLEYFEGITVEQLGSQIQEIRAATNKPNTFVVIDDCQRLAVSDLPLHARMPMLVEQLQMLAKKLNVALLTIWPDFRERSMDVAELWADWTVAADVVMVLQEDAGRTKKLAEPTRAINIHIVKNRGGDRGILAFNFEPAFSRFREAAPR